MHTIIRHFVTNFDTPENEKQPQGVIQKINKLNRTDRAKLRNQLFDRAKLLERSKNPVEIIDWLHHCFHLIDKYSFRFNNVYFSPGHEIKDSIIKVLHDSRASLDLCVFTITDDELARQIIAAYKRGVRVRLITDDEKTTARGSEIEKCAKAGIPIKIDHSHYHMHNKFGIIDNRIAITGSFNWTYTATKHNQENLLATSNYDIVNQYKDEFERLWTEMYDF